MNRRERRAKGLNKKEKAIMIKQSDLDKIKEEAYHEAVARAKLEAFIEMLYLPLNLLREDYGFTKEMLSKYTEDLIDLIESWEHDTITIEDMVKDIKDITGFEIKRKE